jgi:branched-subunit amino acid ABC-type transport system permease component
LLLGAPLAVAIAVVYSRLDPKGFHGFQASLEKPAPFLIGFVALIYVIRSIVTRNPLYVLLAVLCFSLTMREIHFTGTGNGIYVALVVVGIWAFVWRNRLAGPLSDWRHTSWLIATAVMYILSQVIARRAFRPIPGEHEIHRSLEECIETAGHLLFIVTALVGNWRKIKRG